MVIRGVRFGFPFPRTCNRAKQTRLWVPALWEPGTHNKFLRKDDKIVYELSMISKTSIKIDLKMGSRSLGTET